MGVIDQAYFTRMSADATLIALLANFNAQPAIFTIDPAPEGTSLPYIVTAGTLAQSSSKLDSKETPPMPTQRSAGREIFKDIRCYAEDTGSAVAVDAIAERVRFLFHRHRLTITGFITLVGEVVGITNLDEDGVYGRIVTVRQLIMEVI